MRAVSERIREALRLPEDRRHAAVVERLPPSVYALLALGFGAYYAVLSHSVMELGGYTTVDTFVGADVRWMVGDLSNAGANHYRTNTHPLMILMLNPIGLVLNQVTPSGDITALVITTLAGGLSVSLALAFLLQLGCDRVTALLGALLLGFSGGHVVWGSVPDAYLLDGATLMLFFWATLAHPTRVWLLLLTAVLAVGMVTTNLVCVAIIFVAARHGVTWRPGAMLGDGLRFTVLVLGITVGLSIIQDWLYPSATFFFLPHALASRTKYIATESADSRALLLALYTVVFGMALPTPSAKSLAEGKVGLQFGLNKPLAELFVAPNWLFVVLWIGLLCGVAYLFAKRREYLRVAPATMVACVAFNVLLHSIYGRTSEFLLYVPHWTFLLVGLAAMALSVREVSSRVSKSLSRGLLTALVLSAAVGNWLTFQSMLRVLG